MELLKLVIVDDEPILLQGLLDTYDWESMGFEVVGSAKSGVQALEVIRREQPHVVLTDIRMKQMTGLMVMEEIQKEQISCLFVVLSAYRDFEYAKHACDLGAYAYLLKPIDDEQLRSTMTGAYNTCIKQLRSEEKYESWEQLLLKDGDSFLQVVIQKYVQNLIPEEKIAEVFSVLHDLPDNHDFFITVCADIDLIYKITNSLDYEASRYAVIQEIEAHVFEHFSYWKFEGEDGNYVFIIKTQQKNAVRQIKTLLEQAKNEEKCPVIASISKPYKGISGIRKSYEEAQKLFGIASASGASAFTIPEDLEDQEDDSKQFSEDREIRIMNSIRKNDFVELKETFIDFIYHLPKEEARQCQYLHKVMLRVQFMLQDTYGMKEEKKNQFANYYSNLNHLPAVKAVDVCYKILCRAIELRQEEAGKNETGYFKEYMAEAVAYIEEHLQEEDLSIIATAAHVYLNPVHFGRIFKSTFHMTFKQYLVKKKKKKNVWIKQKECWKKEIPVSEQSVKKLVSAILLIFHNYSSNIPENCQVSIKRNTKYEAKIFKFRYPEKIFKIYAYITSSCTFIIYDRSMELYAPYFKK